MQERNLTDANKLLELLEEIDETCGPRYSNSGIKTGIYIDLKDLIKILSKYNKDFEEIIKNYNWIYYDK